MCVARVPKISGCVLNAAASRQDLRDGNSSRGGLAPGVDDDDDEDDDGEGEKRLVARRRSDCR